MGSRRPLAALFLSLVPVASTALPGEREEEEGETGINGGKMRLAHKQTPRKKDERRRRSRASGQKATSAKAGNGIRRHSP